MHSLTTPSPLPPPSPSKTRLVYLLSPHFLHHVSVSSRKNELAALLDSIPEPSNAAADAASVLCRVLGN